MFEKHVIYNLNDEEPKYNFANLQGLNQSTPDTHMLCFLNIHEGLSSPQIIAVLKQFFMCGTYQQSVCAMQVAGNIRRTATWAAEQIGDEIMPG